MKVRKDWDYKRAQAVILHQIGQPIREIANNVGFSKSTVQRAIVRFEQRGDYHDHERSGRPEILTERDLRVLKRLTTGTARESSKELTTELSKATDKVVSDRTVRRYLGKLGYEYKVKLKKPSLTSGHKKARLLWCREKEDWSCKEWENIMFSDESTFFIHKDKNVTKIWRAARKRMTSDCIQAVQGGAAKVGFWGVISAQGTGCCKLYSQNMNSQLYANVIQNELIPSINMWQLEANGIYQQDNATYHKSRDIKALFKDLSINILPWPAKSPDLNSIENLWPIIDKKLKKTPIRTIQELNERLRIEWLSIESTICAKLIKSMPTRIAQCIKAKGGAIDK
ncbi:unnamed protein product [Rotaria sordida]|uniref:Transposase n=1 Tax=Rotaria sordida TaxID=392033 RepID=A0A815X5G2_9BILA|nr:unnamed protein product [Rotaria sordida]CAF1553028.1 unnamed protein product [Rotaria sordida]CAF4197300.1 unnamed protein product [Rotaria sordida]CAF4247819.1 unnamed protein product [Rotaria sordida]